MGSSRRNMKRSVRSQKERKTSVDGKAERTKASIIANAVLVIFECIAMGICFRKFGTGIAFHFTNDANLLVMLFSMFCPGFVRTAKAETRTKPITSVSLSLSYPSDDIHMKKNDVTVSCSTEGIQSVTVQSLNGDIVKFTLSADTASGYYFDSEDESTLGSSDAFSLSGSPAEYDDSSRKSNSRLSVSLLLSSSGDVADENDSEDYDDASGRSGDGLEISRAWWSDAFRPYASWTDLFDASSYTVRLYKNSELVNTCETRNAGYSFVSDITSAGSWTFSVRANSGKDSSGVWADSDTLKINSSGAASTDSESGKSVAAVSGSSSVSERGRSDGIYSSGKLIVAGTNKDNLADNREYDSKTDDKKWIQNDKGWKFGNADGDYTANGWKNINGLWYCFDSEGYMATGWVMDQARGYYYYLSQDDGYMLTDTWTPDGWYVNADGIWDSTKGKRK